MRQFKVGDTVRCLKERNDLTKGKSYVVLNISAIGREPYVQVKNDRGINIVYFANRFELSSSPVQRAGMKRKAGALPRRNLLLL